MITKRKLYLSRLAVFALYAAASCVSARPSRNGVFNENQYVRKDFLVRKAGAMDQDPGWIMNVTITAESLPNVLGNVSGAGLFAGSQASTPNLVRFAITQDKLQLLDQRELSDTLMNSGMQGKNGDQGLRIPNIVNVWPVSHVDLKYRVNLDGETTNFYEENQELNWQDRQWVKLDFAKNDLSDLAPFFAPLNPVIQRCTNMSEASATPIPNSLVTDNDNGYMEFGIELTIPIQYSDTDAAACYQAFGPRAVQFFQLGRSTVTLNLLYSFVRPANYPDNKLDGKYVPMPMSEKDPIRHKYGVFELGTGASANIYRDPNSQLLGANEYLMRFDPNKDIVYYFAPGVPDNYKGFFTNPNGIVDQTNAVLSKAGATGKFKVLNYNDDTTLGDGKAKTPRKFGDVRYSFIVWHSDIDNGAAGLLGVAQFNADPRTGQTLSASVNVFDQTLKDTVVNRLEHFLQAVGAEYINPMTGEFNDQAYNNGMGLPSTCTDGQTVPLVDQAISKKLNLSSTVYGKMQGYMQKPISQYGNLGPINFLPTHDQDFYNAYYAVIPYNTYADPRANRFVNPEGGVFATAAQENWEGLKQLAEFDKMAASIDHGEAAWDVNAADGVPQAIAFNHKIAQLQNAVVEYQHTKARQAVSARSDDAGLYSYVDIYLKNGRKCVGGKWESRADYTKRIYEAIEFNAATHEFGHTLGLRHNFMGSVDAPNYQKDAQGNTILYSSSIMDYTQRLVDTMFQPGATWPPYDAAALAFIYGNNHDTGSAVDPNHPLAGDAKGISGQSNSTSPWKDPLGFQADGTTEIPFLYCTDDHLAYTPLCRQFDAGATPSEIIANEIQQREWNYQWTNFRLYRKFADFGSYGQTVALQFAEYRRFLAQWYFDWSPGELTNTLRLVGIKAPPGGTAGDYYTQLTNKFNQDISVANQLAAAYHRAIIDQASGERPFITSFDPFYGDTTQQGIQLDKVISILSFSTLWPAISEYDPSQAGAFVASNAIGDDVSYNTLASGVLEDFLGAAFATYAYAQIGPIAAFAEETHSAMWPGPLSMQAWIGAHTFDRERDFLDYMRRIAVDHQFPNCDENGLNCHPCTSLDNCSYDPRPIQTKQSQITQSDRYNRFQGPDGRTYIWMKLPTRNEWVLADKDRNVAMYTLMLNWSTDVVNAEDDGYGGADFLELKIRFALDAFNYFDDSQTNAH